MRGGGVSIYIYIYIYNERLIDRQIGSRLDRYTYMHTYMCIHTYTKHVYDVYLYICVTHRLLAGISAQDAEVSSNPFGF